MKISVIGTGYVGLVSGSCLADVGNQVWCVDKDSLKIDKLKRNEIPIYEPGLESVVSLNTKEGRLYFTTDLKAALDNSDICFITVDTPPDGDGKADLTNVLAVAKSLGQLIDSYKIVVTKSTVPVGTTFRVKEAISEELRKRKLNPEKLIDVASNPEFLKEGDAVSDFMKPNRVVVGVEKEEVGKILHELYSPFMRKTDRFLVMDVLSSELSKYAANAMLAVRISFINEISRLCDIVGADINAIRRSLGTDPRIGPDFLYPGLGYGGSCLPKDTKALINLGQEYKSNISVVEAADHTNDLHRDWFWQKIFKYFNNDISNKKIAVWGVAFKANTDDIRFSAAIDLINNILKHNGKVSIHDPIAMNNAKKVLEKNVICCDEKYDCLEGADALVICTEWREFRSPDFNKVKELMNGPVIFDGRNLFDPKTVISNGFEYFGVGRKDSSCHSRV